MSSDNKENAYSISVPVGDLAMHFILNPKADPHLQWMMRYSNEVVSIRFIAAEILSSFDYLLSENIPTVEAVRRLKLLRAARSAALRT